MLRLFSFLPPIGFYVLAIAILAGTYSFHMTTLAENPDADTNRIWLVGGILAFLLGFSGFQKAMEDRGKASQPRVSSSDVLQKLTPMTTGGKDADLDIPPPITHGPEANSPLGRVRARTSQVQNF